MLMILQDEGYKNICIRNNKLCGTLQFINTAGVCIGLDEISYENKYCFDTMQNAKLFLSEWDGSYKPVIGEDGCIAIN